MANQQQAIGIAILLLVLIISPIIIFLVRNVTATIHIFSLTLSTKEQELVHEKQKMDDLLFHTLPLQVPQFLIGPIRPSHPSRLQRRSKQTIKSSQSTWRTSQYSSGDLFVHQALTPLSVI
jgi:hypothetical protein